MTTQSSINQFLSQKKLALAGVSRSRKKFGNVILKDLTNKGYEVSLIHPEAKEIDGIACYSNLSEIPDQVTGLITVVTPGQTEKLVQEAVEYGIKNIWMQQGSESQEAIKFCLDKNINVVHGECILMFAQPTGFHKFHRWLWCLFGKLPKN